MRRQWCAVLGDAFFPRQPKQGAFCVALVVLQRLGRQARGYLMELGEIGSNRAVAGRDYLERLVQRFDDLPQGCRPVAASLLRQLVRLGDDHDGIGEGGLD